MLDQALLHRAEMRPHRLLGFRRIALGDRDRDAAMVGGVDRLVVDAMRGLAAVGVPLATLYRGVLPFAVVQILALLIITYWPELSLYLTRSL